MSAGDLVTPLLALVGVVGLLLLLGIGLRRFAPALTGPGDGGGEIRTVASRAVDARHRALILRCRGRDYLLLLSPSGVCVVDRLGAPEG